MHVLKVNLLGKPFGLRVLLEDVLVFREVKIPTNTAQFNTLGIHGRGQELVGLRLVLKQLRVAQVSILEEARGVENSGIEVVWPDALYQSLHSLLLTLIQVPQLRQGLILLNLHCESEFVDWLAIEDRRHLVLGLLVRLFRVVIVFLVDSVVIETSFAPSELLLFLLSPCLRLSLFLQDFLHYRVSHLLSHLGDCVLLDGVALFLVCLRLGVPDLHLVLGLSSLRINVVVDRVVILIPLIVEVNQGLLILIYVVVNVL